MNSLKRVKILVFKLLQNKQSCRIYEKIFRFSQLLRKVLVVFYLDPLSHHTKRRYLLENISKLEINIFPSNISKGLSRYLYILKFEWYFTKYILYKLLHSYFSRVSQKFSPLYYFCPMTYCIYLLYLLVRRTVSAIRLPTRPLHPSLVSTWPLLQTWLVAWRRKLRTLLVRPYNTLGSCSRIFPDLST